MGTKNFPGGNFSGMETVEIFEFLLGFARPGGNGFGSQTLNKDCSGIQSSIEAQIFVPTSMKPKLYSQPITLLQFTHWVSVE